MTLVYELRKQILVLLHVIIGAPIHKKHIAETAQLKPQFSPGDGTLEKLVEEVDLGFNPYERAGTDERDIGVAVGEIPFNSVCDFREGVMGSCKVQRPVSVGEILVSPVTASYEDKEGEAQRKTFWLVMLKTRRCYDFCGHLGSLLTMDKDIMGKIRETQQGHGATSNYLTWLQDLIRDVLLFSYKLSPNVGAFLKMQVRSIVLLFFYATNK